ncbi:MAG: acyl-CoA dehydrogenase family protein, partial [Planctomycetota bacterium]|nr:acyl-CoA dehydrogenase family protein [Planctomycetota bacterium]
MELHFMSELLSDELRAMRDSAKDFAEREIAPTVEKDEKEHRFRPEIVRKMAELGFFGCVIPEEYGGMGLEDGFLASCVITEEIARVSPSYGLPFNLQMMAPALTILKFGNEAQKKRYIPDFVSAKKFGCFAITEPNSGSDVASMRTYAKRDGDYYVLNGQKTWISGIPVADAGLVYAYTDKEAKHRGLSAFIVDLKEIKGVTMIPI